MTNENILTHENFPICITFLYVLMNRDSWILALQEDPGLVPRICQVSKLY